MHVVLVEPLIPQNTGNISRLCAGVDADLHLVGELGFSLEDKYLKRAGLDYWPHVKLHRHDTLDEALADAPADQVAFFSSHATRPYSEFSPGPDAWFVFGKETTGLGDQVRAREQGRLFRIPITDKVRSLNLSNSVAIVLYDALRQHGFPGLV